MVLRISAKEALSNARTNRFNQWHGVATDEATTNADAASRRLCNEFARIEPTPPPRRFDLKAPVFTMGSCFAREIEAALRAAGGHVISLDRAKMDRPEFHDGEGTVRSGFFHRFTPRAIWHEFKIAFDELPGWKANSSLLFPRGEELEDFNYWAVKGSDLSARAHGVRRSLAREFVQRVTEAELVILTLGLIEAWVHKPTGFDCNRIDPRVIARRPEEFELVFLDYEDTIFCLADVRRMLKRYHKTGDFQLVVTVSPVPLGSTFSTDDIIVANERSKSVLRAAAGKFCSDNPDVRYFPSYEFVRFSEPAAAWRPDRLHVQRAMVNHIVKTFTRTYFGQGRVKNSVAA
jgi:hypothetical protein